MRPSPRHHRAIRGTAAVELVLILPVIVALLAVSVDMGRLLLAYHTVSKSVRAATRYLARVDGGPAGLGLNCAAGRLAGESPPARAARRLAMTGRLDGDPAAEPLVPGWTATSLDAATTGIQIVLDCLDNADGALGGLYDGAARVPGIVVTATVPFRVSLGRVLGLGPTLSFTITRRMAHVGV